MNIISIKNKNIMFTYIIYPTYKSNIFSIYSYLCSFNSFLNLQKYILIISLKTINFNKYKFVNL